MPWKQTLGQAEGVLDAGASLNSVFGQVFFLQWDCFQCWTRWEPEGFAIVKHASGRIWGRGRELREGAVRYIHVLVGNCCHDRGGGPIEFTGYYGVGCRVGSRGHLSSGDAMRNLHTLGCWAWCRLLRIVERIEAGLCALWGRVFELLEELKELVVKFFKFPESVTRLV